MQILHYIVMNGVIFTQSTAIFSIFKFSSHELFQHQKSLKSNTYAYNGLQLNFLALTLPELN